jgi:hypothetical protein
MKIDLDVLRQHHPLVAQEVIKNPSRFYKIAKNNLERGILGDSKPGYTAKVEHFKISF